MGANASPGPWGPHRPSPRAAPTPLRQGAREGEVAQGHTATLPPKLASRPIRVTGTFRSRARSLS